MRGFYYESDPEITKIGNCSKSRVPRKTRKTPPKITLQTPFLALKTPKNGQKNPRPASRGESKNRCNYFCESDLASFLAFLAAFLLAFFSFLAAFFSALDIFWLLAGAAVEPASWATATPSSIEAANSNVSSFFIFLNSP